MDERPQGVLREEAVSVDLSGRETAARTEYLDGNTHAGGYSGSSARRLRRAADGISISFTRPGSAAQRGQ